MSYNIINISGMSGISPPTTLLTVPVSINVYGSNNILMGNPIGWTDIIISGIVRKIPYY